TRRSSRRTALTFIGSAPARVKIVENIQSPQKSFHVTDLLVVARCAGVEGDVTCLPNFMDIVKEVLVSAKQLFLALIKGPSCIVGVGVRKVSASVDHSSHSR